MGIRSVGEDMDSVMSKVIAAIFAAIIIWAFKEYFFRRRLYLIQPKLFDYSDLASAKNAKTIELTVFNGGAKAEEKIVVQLSPMFTYTVVASNQSGLVVSKDGVFQIERLAPQEDVTIVLTAEGGEFRKDHVIGVSSKETKGRIKASLQDARVTPAQSAVAAIVIFFFFPLGGYVFGKLLEDEIGPAVVQQFSSTHNLIFKVDNKRIKLLSLDKKKVNKLDGMYRVVSASRTGDLVSVELEIENKLEERVEISIYATSPMAEGRDGHWSDINPNINSVIVFPSSNKRLEIVDYLPADVTPNLVVLQVVIETLEGRVDFYEDIILSNP